MGFKWLLVRINPECDTALNEFMAKDKALTRTEIIRRAISLYKFVKDMLREGKEVVVRDPATGEETPLGPRA